MAEQSGNMAEVLETLKSIEQSQSKLTAAVESISQRTAQAGLASSASLGADDNVKSEDNLAASSSSMRDADRRNSMGEPSLQAPATPSSPGQRSGFTSRIILT